MPPASALATSSPKAFYLSLAVVTLAFIGPVIGLFRFAVSSSLYSYILLVPVVSLYLVWQRKAALRYVTKAVRALTWLPLAVGAALLAWYFAARSDGEIWATQDRLALMIPAWLLFAGAVCLRFLTTETLRTLAFPLGFLVFLVPLPVAVETGLEGFLQHGSAVAAHALFRLAGTSVFVDGLAFQLPGITLQIAPECSGIHSSLVLFITSTLAGYFFLRSPVRRTILALAVIPLALARNGLRVLVIGELCVRIGPEMINSYIHRHGGPVFFVLSLIPLSLFLLLLVRSERKPRPDTAHSPQTT